MGCLSTTECTYLPTFKKRTPCMVFPNGIHSLYARNKTVHSFSKKKKKVAWFSKTEDCNPLHKKQALHGFTKNRILHGVTKNGTLYVFTKQKTATSCIRKHYKVFQKKKNLHGYTKKGTSTF